MFYLNEKYLNKKEKIFSRLFDIKIMILIFYQNSNSQIKHQNTNEHVSLVKYEKITKIYLLFLFRQIFLSMNSILKLK